MLRRNPKLSLPTERVEVDSRGRVVIPARFRKALSIKSGDKMEILSRGKYLVISKLAPEPVKAICLGCGKTEDETKMVLKSSDGHYGVCDTCDKKGFKFKEVK